jgi:hypothetical protein
MAELSAYTAVTKAKADGAPATPGRYVPYDIRATQATNIADKGMPGRGSLGIVVIYLAIAAVCCVVRHRLGVRNENCFE